MPIFALIASETYTALSDTAKTRLSLDLSTFLKEKHEFFLPSLSPPKQTNTPCKPAASDQLSQTKAKARRALMGFHYAAKCCSISGSSAFSYLNAPAVPRSLEIRQLFPYALQK